MERRSSEASLHDLTKKEYSDLIFPCDLASPIWASEGTSKEVVKMGKNKLNELLENAEDWKPSGYASPEITGVEFIEDGLEDASMPALKVSAKRGLRFIDPTDEQLEALREEGLQRFISEDEGEKKIFARRKEESWVKVFNYRRYGWRAYVSEDLRGYEIPPFLVYANHNRSHYSGVGESLKDVLRISLVRFVERFHEMYGYDDASGSIFKELRSFDLPKGEAKEYNSEPYLEEFNEGLGKLIDEAHGWAEAHKDSNYPGPQIAGAIAEDL